MLPPSCLTLDGPGWAQEAAGVLLKGRSAGMQLEPFDLRRPSRCYAEAPVNSSGCLLSTYLTDAYKETRALLGPQAPPGNRLQGLGLAPLVGARLLCTALLLLLPRQGIGVVR